HSSLTVGADPMESQQPLPPEISALQDLRGHPVVDEWVEPLGDEATAVRRLLHPADAVLRLVRRAAVPDLVVPHDRGPGRAERALHAAALVRELAPVRLPAAAVAAGDELRRTQLLVHLAEVIVEV